MIAEIERLRPGIVGISVLGGSYQNSLKLAEAAKAVGSVVVFGNDQAAHLSRRILARRPQVDFVIASEYGEQGLKVYGSFVLGTDPETPKTMRETLRWIERAVKEEFLHNVEGTTNPALVRQFLW